MATPTIRTTPSNLVNLGRGLVARSSDHTRQPTVSLGDGRKVRLASADLDRIIRRKLDELESDLTRW